MAVRQAQDEIIEGIMGRSREGRALACTEERLKEEYQKALMGRPVEGESAVGDGSVFVIDKIRQERVVEMKPFRKEGTGDE